MLANIVKGINGAVLGARNDDGLRLQVEDEEIAWFRDIWATPATSQVFAQSLSLS